jgi:hypothetical protein
VNRRMRWAVTAALATLLLVAMGAVAVADNVQNDVVTGGNDTFVAGGSTTVNYRITANSGDGQTGCNAVDGSAATVTINTPAGVTTVPGSLVFTSCGTDQAVVFSSSAAGDYEITVSVSDAGVGTYNVNPAKFTLHVTAVPPPSDTTPPVISYVLDPASPDGNAGWYRSEVTLTWTVTEDESPGSLLTDGCVDQNVTADQLETSYSCSATSDGGSAGPVVVSIKRDATPPTVALVGGPQDGATYYFGFVPDEPTCSASDDTSGLAGACVVSGYSDAIGSHTVSASAEDEAGNDATVEASYQVLAWDLSGFYRPVDMGGVFNVVKGGSTVPLKFNVYAGWTELTDPAVVASLKQAKIACDNSSPTDVIEATATGGTSLRYDATGGQFVYNWQTPKAAGLCYRVTLETLDGSSLVALFKLK